MRLLKKIFMILAIIILAFSAVGLLFFSSHIHVDRSISIARKQADVYNYISDLRNFNKWSPWYELDPNAKYAFEGPATGIGSKIKWESNVKEVGTGSLTASLLKPDSVVQLDLGMMENGGAKATFVCVPENSGTKVTWNMDVNAGANPLLRVLGYFMEGALGKYFEKGLSTMKMRLETVQDTSDIRLQ